MKISIGSDHRGFALKSRIKKEYDYQWDDVGSHSSDRSDYPLYAQKVCRHILDSTTSYGILICGSGIGMAMAANRYQYIYAALCWSEEVARVAHADDGANVLVLSADMVDETTNIAIVKAMVDAWKGQTFKKGLYQERLDMIDSSV